MTVSGVVRNGMIVPDTPLLVPEGTRVTIEVANGEKTSPAIDRCEGIWKGKVRIAPDFDELPEDIARTFEAQ